MPFLFLPLYPTSWATLSPPVHDNDGLTYLSWLAYLRTIVFSGPVERSFALLWIIPLLHFSLACLNIYDGMSSHGLSSLGCCCQFPKKRIQLFAGGGIVQEEDDEWCKYNEPHLCNCRVRALLFPSPCRHRVGFCISSGVDWMEGVPVCHWPCVLHSLVVCWPRNIITWYLPFTYYSNPVILVTVDWISRSSLAISFLVLVITCECGPLAALHLSFMVLYFFELSFTIEWVMVPVLFCRAFLL